MLVWAVIMLVQDVIKREFLLIIKITMLVQSYPKYKETKLNQWSNNLFLALSFLNFFPHFIGLVVSSNILVDVLSFTLWFCYIYTLRENLNLGTITSSNVIELWSVKRYMDFDNHILQFPFPYKYWNINSI